MKLSANKLLKLWLCLTVVVFSSINPSLVSARPVTANNDVAKINDWLERRSILDGINYVLPEVSPPRKVAIISVNWKYKDEPLNTQKDKALADEFFKKLGYDKLFFVNNFKDDEDFYLRLDKIRLQLTSNDIIAFYYSGHGFRYKGLEYLEPLNSKQKMHELELKAKAVSLRDAINTISEIPKRGNIEYKTNEYKLRPRFVWGIFDACRVSKTINGVEIDPEKGTSDKQRRITHRNIDLFLASREGFPAHVPNNHPSYFTDALNHAMFNPDHLYCNGECFQSDIDNLYRAAGEKLVSIKPGQEADRRPWASTKIHFSEYERGLEENKKLDVRYYDAWNSALKDIVNDIANKKFGEARSKLKSQLRNYADSPYYSQMIYIEKNRLIERDGYENEN